MSIRDIHPMNNLPQLASLVRYYIALSTTAAQSGHLTSSLSAVELMVGLVFGGVFHFDPHHPESLDNDRLIFSKGHAAPLFYALWAAAGYVTQDDLRGLRTFESALEGHPSMRFPLTEAATGSLGQGLSIGVGMALASRVDGRENSIYVLLGDSEMAEGQVWEAMQLAAHYQLGNLVGMIDVNRLGQRGETMDGHDVDSIAEKCAAFGWETIVIDGHDLQHITDALSAVKAHDMPTMIIAKTIKGKGMKAWEDRNGWHSKPLSPEQFKQFVLDLPSFDKKLVGKIALPFRTVASKSDVSKRDAIALTEKKQYVMGEKVATKKAFGETVVRLGMHEPSLVVLDAEVSNSTHTDLFQAEFPERFFEMFVAEQNMASVAVGMARRGKYPVVSSFAAFLTRATDQFRMAAYSQVSMLVAGSYAGVSIGKDGFSQMGLEDIAIFRAVFGSTVLYPSDAVSTRKLLQQVPKIHGITYLRLTREPTPVLYPPETAFPIGGSHVLKTSAKDVATVVAAGITLHEALKAYEMLHDKGISIRVIDLYSITPIDEKTLTTAAKETGHLIVVEDHYPEGGIAEAVRTALSSVAVDITSLAVRKMPRSGEPSELLAYEEIDADAIVRAVEKVYNKHDAKHL